MNKRPRKIVGVRRILIIFYRLIGLIIGSLTLIFCFRFIGSFALTHVTAIAIAISTKEPAIKLKRNADKLDVIIII